MANQRKQTTGIQQLAYNPPTPYRLDLEIFSASELRRRGTKEELCSTKRYAFHLLVCVTHGKCSHMVDFKSLICTPGSLLVLCPGQAHSFGPEKDWEGWVILFLPEFLLRTR